MSDLHKSQVKYKGEDSPASVTISSSTLKGAIKVNHSDKKKNLKEGSLWIFPNFNI